MTEEEHPAEIRAAGPADGDARDEFVMAHPRATFFHQGRWRRFVERTYGHQSRELIALVDGQVTGVLPMMLCRGPLWRRRLVSMPYSVYGGPLGTDRETETALIQAAGKLAEAERVSYLELRCLQDPGGDLPASSLYCTFIKDLPEDPAECLERMPKKARAEARKARKRHELELGEGSWYLEDLTRLFLHNKHSLGSPAFPQEHFAGVLAEFDRDAYVHVVRKDGKPVSAVLSFGFRDTLIAYYAGTAPGADRAYSASNFMYLALQEWAVERGFKVFDFCRSRVDSGAYSFKIHQGFEPTPLSYRYHLVRAGGLPSFNPSNPRTAFLRRTWSRLPLWMARRMSRRLARYLT